MNTLKIIRNWCCALALGFSPLAMADGATSGTLLYIQPFEYTNPIRLWHYSLNYWFEQGPIVEKLALKKFGEKYGPVSMCESNQSGKMLIWLQPKMFYNPQSQLFYGKVVANVYTGTGKLVSSYEGEANTWGSLMIVPQKNIEKSYALTLDNLLEKMRADPQLTNLPESTNTSEQTPCSMVTLLPVPKVRAMGF